VPRVTRRVTGRRVRALGMNCLRVRGGAGLAPAAGSRTHSADAHQ